MNSRERFWATCKHQNKSTPPIDYLAHKKTDESLRSFLGVGTEEELLDYLGCDFYYLPGRDISQNEGFMKFYKGTPLHLSDRQRICPFGILWQRGAYDHKFTVDEAISGPLENAQTQQDILKHAWPSPSDFDFSPLHYECESHSGRVIIGGFWTGIMGDSYRLLGFENFLLNTALNPKLAKTLVDKITEVYLELNHAVFSELKGKMDVWYFGNDFGSQHGMLLSPETWHRLFFYNIKELVALAHGYGLKVMMHSCGAISPIIPFLIEAGVDILDPIQVTAKDMEPEKLSAKFGKDIVFHGGIDTQKVLPGSTPQEASEHALSVTETLNRDGGYIFAPSQLLGADIPVQNIVAIYNAVRKTRGLF